MAVPIATPPVIPDFDKLIDRIILNLRFDTTTSDNLKKYFEELNDSTKFAMISSPELDKLTTDLISSDTFLSGLLNRSDVPDDSKKAITELNQELAKLQGLIFLRKIFKTSDSSEIINILVDTFKTKIDTINKILKQNLIPEKEEEEEASPLPPPPGGTKYFSVGGGKNYHQKYLNYKTKYLQLKKSL
jgi:hypothetical protein